MHAVGRGADLSLTTLVAGVLADGLLAMLAKLRKECTHEDR
jgi:hypothetical protein